MFLMMLLICAAVVIAFAALAIKLKKVRGLFVVLTVLALLPTAVLGVIVAGFGDILNYPGDPADAVTQWRVLGVLGMESEEATEDARALMELIDACLTADPVGEAKLQEFSAVQTVALTHLDTQAWLEGLAKETEEQLNRIVQTNVRKDV